MLLNRHDAHRILLFYILNLVKKFSNAIFKLLSFGSLKAKLGKLFDHIPYDLL